MSGYENDKRDLARRLARIEVQVRGIARMVDEDRYCIDVLDQVSAVKKGLERVSLTLFRGHLDHCVSDAVLKDSDRGRAKLDEATSAIERLLRS